MFYIHCRRSILHKNLSFWLSWQITENQATRTFFLCPQSSVPLKRMYLFHLLTVPTTPYCLPGKGASCQRLGVPTPALVVSLTLVVPFARVPPSLLRFPITRLSPAGAWAPLSWARLAGPRRQSWSLVHICSSNSLQWAAGRMRATLTTVP